MAKKPRMGRNLNALLGSASSQKKRQQAEQVAEDTAPDDGAVPAETPSVPADEVTTAADSSTTDKVRPIHSASSASAAAPAAAASSPGADHAASATAASPSAADETARPGDQLRLLPVEKIRRGAFQPRRHFDRELLEELAGSLKSQGMIQPIIVREFAGAYELVAGERRWRAAQLAGMSEVPAIIRRMEDEAVAAVSLIENIQRKDLNPLEEAAALVRLCDEFGMTQKKVAEAVGRSRVAVTNLIRLLELPEDVKLMVDKGELAFAQARTILGAPKERQLEIARMAVAKGMTVRALEALVRRVSEGGDVAPASARRDAVVDPDIERLNRRLSEQLGTTVRVQHRANGSGRLEIRYSSSDELEGILAHIQ
ncbi:MAG: chromosome partitioning protein ParB [Gammaproteobacteria bacterium]|nr:MAG: chromosome partitioning protein ParB [Gammaproteobacteria bacterium]PIE37243.1 MAG: chromosome partitioning protein ParB [Gammaproteobacteria bacterium]